MSYRHLKIIILVTLFWAANAMAAGNPANIPMIFGTFTPEPGVWSKYEVLDKKTGHKSAITVAVVGQEDGMYWYEVSVHKNSSVNIVKMLLRGDPNDPANIQRLIVKSGSKPAQEMPIDFVRMGQAMADNMSAESRGVAGGAELKHERIGKSQVTVQAGSFEVVTNRVVDGAGKQYGTYNFSAKVKPFGLVTSDTEDSSMQLLAYGNDAKSVIIEEPQLFKLPPGMLNAIQQGIMPGVGGHPAGR